MKKAIILAASFVAFESVADFSNIPRTKGELVSQSHPELGRLTTIEVLGDYIIAIPEIPSAPAGADFIVRAIDISDPANPVTVRDFGTTQHPILAHGTYRRGNEMYIGGYPNDAVRLEEDGSLSHVVWSGPDAHFNNSGMYHPWAAAHWWSYQEVEGLAWLNLDGERTAEWDHLGLTQVVGFPTILGNLLIYSSDQTLSGMATYDISDPTNPVLLDVFNLPETHPTFTQPLYNSEIGQLENVPVEYGLGGYWSAPYGHYMVFARRGENPGVQVVDFSDPTNLSIHCEVFFNDPERNLPSRIDSDASIRNVMYLNFQDEFIFAERLKINIETCELDMVIDERASGVETSQYARPIGNLWLTGGGANHILRSDGNQEGGLGIFAHQAEPDTRPPFVAYHIPQAGQTNYPVFAPISVSIPETLDTRTIIPGQTIIVEEVNGSTVPVDYIFSHTGTLTIDPIAYLASNTSYRVTLVGIEDAVGNAMDPYSFTFTTGDMDNNVPTINAVEFTSQEVIEPGQSISVNVNATDEDGDSLEYRFRIGDDPYNEWSSGSAFSQVINTEGVYTINIQVRDNSGAQVAQTVNFSVVIPPPPLIKSVSSSPMALSTNNSDLWVVNPDNRGASQLRTSNLGIIREARRGTKPVSIGIDQYDEEWVVYEGSDSIESIGSREVIQFDYGSNPTAIVMDNENSVAYVALHGSGDVVKIDMTTLNEIGRVSGLTNVHALSLSGDRSHLLATRFISPQSWGEVYAIDPDTMTLETTIILEQSLVNDSLFDGRGVPNYLAHVAIDGYSQFAYVVGKKDNIARGLINTNAELDEDNTVRTFIAVIDLNTMSEIKAARVDIDNSDSPSAITFSQNEGHVFVALQGNNMISVFGRNSETGRLSNGPVSNFAVGLAPQGVLLNDAGDKLFVKNFTDRSVSQIDLTAFNSGNLINPPISTGYSIDTNRELLSANVLRGKQIFYNASFGLNEEGETNGRMSAEGYMSCATCHFDGGEDGRVYDFSGRGEGLRNNLTLAGRGSSGLSLFHWSANFDEIQDFENDIRHQFLGRGLMNDADFEATEDPFGVPKAGSSIDLDALAAYVDSLSKNTVDKSPNKTANGALTADGIAGHDIYVDLNCHSCHGRFLFSDGITHDVGTLREYSGSLTALRTPFLLNVFNSAPYMHDGSAATVDEVFITVGGEVTQAEDAVLSSGVEVISSVGFSYFRKGAAVEVTHGDTLTITEQSDSDRTAFVRVRYGSAQTGTDLVVEVNGERYVHTLTALPTAENQDVAFLEAKFVVSLTPGSNTIIVTPEMTGSANRLVIDDITISTPAHESAADVHTRVNQLTETQKGQLYEYLLQIDRGNNVPN